MSAKPRRFAFERAARADGKKSLLSGEVRYGEFQSDFSDAGSQRVLASAAVVVAHELGRQAAREYFRDLIQKRRSS